MKFNTKVLIACLFLSLSLVNFSQAALVKCGQHQQNPDQEKSQECTISNLFQGVIEIVNFLIGSATLLAIGYVLYGGVRMILARGNSQALEIAKNTMFNAVEGLIIVLLAYLIVTYVVALLTGGSFSFKNALQIFNIP